MILSTHRRSLANRRRSAFTLLEVLVVVAILVVLASVASIYVFRYLEDAKIDKAKLQAKNIEKAAKSYILKNNGSSEGLSLAALIAPPKPLLEGGQEAITTPFNEQYVLDIAQVNESGEENVIVYFKGPDGRTYYSNGRVQ
jgi:general secretion pathway protein G